MKITVIICTYNPVKQIIDKVLFQLLNQTLQKQEWELIVIDNNSQIPVESWIDLSWHPDGRVVREPKPGLMNARIRGCAEAKNSILVFIDDDNFASSDYLIRVQAQAEKYPQLGAWGGKSLPDYEQNPPDWFEKTGINLGCRDLGNQEYFHHPTGEIKEYPRFAPIGTGMIIRKPVFEMVITEIKKSPVRLALGRTGDKLVSGEDNDMMLTVLKLGWGLGYFPDLVINHGIPAKRVSKTYLASMALESNKSWVVVLAIHGINPWSPINPFTVPIRKLKSYFSLHAWESEVNYIRWKGSCGIFEGRAAIKSLRLIEQEIVD